MQSALKCNEIEKGPEVKPPLGNARTIQRSENSATHNNVPSRRGTFVAPRGATMVRKDGPWGTLISPQFLLFWASAWPAGWFSKRDGRPAVRNGPWRVGWAGPCGERDVPARREFRFYLGVARCNLSLPACVYLLSTKHRSFFVPVRPSQP